VKGLDPRSKRVEMTEEEPSDEASVRERWNRRARRFDAWYGQFEGAAENAVDWQLLNRYLPRNRKARILDAAGGTGRMTLPLAKLGYSVTLCDFSPGMLAVAREKLLREDLLNRVELVECDVRHLRLPDESFEFVLCWDGTSAALKELIRVTKRGGRVSLFVVNRCGTALRDFRKNPAEALALLRAEPSGASHHDGSHLALSVEEVRIRFEKEDLRVLGVYAVCGLLPLLGLPARVRNARQWNPGFLEQVTEMLVRLSEEPSMQGLSRHLVLYAERR
jgi:ubiquinone/menaquinone biosynthesis C-methylase UbiE